MGSPDRFGVEEPIKRVDSAVILAKYGRLAIQNAAKPTFKDVPARAIPYAAALKEAEMAAGQPHVYVGAAENIMRGEAAVIFHRALGGMKLLEGTSENRHSQRVECTLPAHFAGSFRENLIEI